ncbi:MAG: outer membrane beta-barrel protein [Acidobacteriota bacterium]|nr:outer membrane beta-barrel protein [Acidobacteriota bacterium]
MRRIVTTLLVCSALFGASTDAAAQTPWEDRVFINIGFGVESGSSTLADTKPVSIYEEAGSVSTSSTYTSGSLFDAGIGVRIWKNLSVGAGYHQEQNTADIEVTGSAPHPVFFNTPRSFSATAGGDQFRKERAMHLQVGWMVPFGTKLDVLLFAGPSFFRLEQPVVSAVTISEVGAPYTEVLANATVASRKKSMVGYNVGADVSYMMWQNDSVRVGGGVFLRYAAASTTVLLLQSEHDTTAGGLQFGFGARFRF